MEGKLADTMSQAAQWRRARTLRDSVNQPCVRNEGPPEVRQTENAFHRIDFAVSTRQTLNISANWFSQICVLKVCLNVAVPQGVLTSSGNTRPHLPPPTAHRPPTPADSCHSLSHLPTPAFAAAAAAITN